MPRHPGTEVALPLDLRRLRTLHQVAQRGSFSHAANDLHFTQSAVSQQVANLERDVGIQLVHRSPVALTDAGAALCRRYEAALAELSAAHVELESLREGRDGTVRIAAPPFAVARLLPFAASLFATKFRDTTLSIRPLARSEAMAALRSGDVDLAISYEYQAEAGEPRFSCRKTPLLQDHLTVALHEAHALARRDSLHLSDLTHLRWIHAPEADIPRDALAAQPLTPNVRVNGIGLDGVQALVAAGLGVALVYGLDQRADLAVRHVPITDYPATRHVYAAVLTTHPPGSPVAAMLEALALAARRVTRNPPQPASVTAVAGRR